MQLPGIQDPEQRQGVDRQDRRAPEFKLVWTTIISVSDALARRARRRVTKSFTGTPPADGGP